MPSWQQIGESPDLGRLEGMVDTLGGTLGGVAAALRVVSTSLSIVARSIDIPNPLRIVVDAAVSTVEHATLDVMHNNVAVAGHLNMHWDPMWEYDRGDGPAIGGRTDFINDGKLPYRGTGIRGWLSDIAISSYDPTDPMRPVTDNGTKVQGAIFLLGVNDGADLTILQSALRVFPDIGHLKDALDIKNTMKTATDSYKALLRLGPIATDPAARPSTVTTKQAVKDAFGSLIQEGLTGTNVASSNVFEDLGANFSSSVQLGDNLKISNSDTYYEILDISTTSLVVTPAIARDNSTVQVSWEIRRGGIALAISKLPKDVQEFVPKIGDLPIWLSVPLSSLIPSISSLFAGLTRVAGLIKTSNKAGAVGRLSVLLNEKAALIEQIIVTLRELLDLVDAITAFFTQAYVLVLTSDRGGMSGFINSALSADNLPDFGTRGVVIGTVVVATSDDPSDHFENFFNLIGLTLSSYTTTTTVRTQALADTWNAQF